MVLRKAGLGGCKESRAVSYSAGRWPGGSAALEFGGGNLVSVSV